MKYRNLSGIVFLHKHEPVSFEELPVKRQLQILDINDRAFIVEMCLKLAATIVRLGEQFDLVSVPEWGE